MKAWFERRKELKAKKERANTMQAMIDRSKRGWMFNSYILIEKSSEVIHIRLEDIPEHVYIADRLGEQFDWPGAIKALLKLG